MTTPYGPLKRLYCWLYFGIEASGLLLVLRATIYKLGATSKTYHSRAGVAHAHSMTILYIDCCPGRLTKSKVQEILCPIIEA